MFSTPILLITFNRPKHTLKTWEAIKKYHPQKVFVFQDGARVDNIDDLDKCKAVRAIFSEKIDWDCELKTFYSDVNLGCGGGPVKAISWFFEHVSDGIIMEDDCLPHDHFFKYCQILLDRYKQINEVMVVGATTYHDNYPCNDSYLFSRYFTGGAWATWQRAWQGFSLNLENVDIKLFQKTIKKQFYSSAEVSWWVAKVKQIKADHSKKHYWDYQMQIHILQNNGLAIRPQKNLISNIGFDMEGTHTHSNDTRGGRPVYPCLPLVHPDEIKVNSRNDYLFMAKKHQQRIDKRLIKWIYNYSNESNGSLNALLKYYKQKKKAWKSK
jgi:hypothetical protein